MVDPNALQFLTQLTHLTYDLSLQRRQMDVERHRAQELATSRYADPKRLVRHGFKVYSQSDEDGIIQRNLQPDRRDRPHIYRIRS